MLSQPSQKSERNTAWFLKTALLVTSFALPCVAFAAPQAQAPILVDAVVASVDGKPITLSDVARNIRPPRQLTLSELKSNPEAQLALDDLILREVIAEEARQKRVGVSNSEIERYLDEVASRNSLSRPDFEKALSKEGIDIESYRERIRSEILKSKLASTIASGSAAVSDKEVFAYLEAQPFAAQKKNRIQLRQLFISNSDRSPDEFAARVEKVKALLADDEDFDDIVREYSDAPDASDGGLMAEIPVGDLSPDVFGAVAQLDEDDISDAVPTDSGLFYFQVENRVEVDRDEQFSAEELAAARSMLERERVNNKISTYFSSEILSLHAVDKKS